MKPQILTTESIERVTRVEVIDNTGRILTRRDIGADFSIQDDGRTLKIFISEKVDTPD